MPKTKVWVDHSKSWYCESCSCELRIRHYDGPVNFIEHGYKHQDKEYCVGCIRGVRARAIVRDFAQATPDQFRKLQGRAKKWLNWRPK